MEVGTDDENLLLDFFDLLELDKVGSNNSPLEHRRNSLALADTKKISSSMHNLNGASTNIGLMGQFNLK